MKKILALALTGMFLLSACGAPKEGVEVSDAWARAATQGMNSAVYFVIVNHNTKADELIGAASDTAEVVEIHESKMEGDMMMMNHLEAVALEPSVKVEFKPGGYHVMLIRLTRDLKTGDEIEVTLQFKNSPSITVKAMVMEGGDDMQSMDNYNP